MYWIVVGINYYIACKWIFKLAVAVAILANKEREWRCRDLGIRGVGNQR